MYNLTRNISVVHQLSQQKYNLEQEKIKHLQEIRERNIILVSTFFSILTLCILLVSIIRSNRKLRIQKATIENQSKQLEILNNTKDKFFGIISHDMRSPLNSIKSVSMLLSEFIGTMDKTKIEKLARELGSTVENTIRMTENLSSWARIQMKDFKTVQEKFSITEIISPVYRIYGEVAKQKEIGLECEFDHTLTVYGDKNQIEFILRNLVNNAIKFTNRGGSVGIRATPLNEKELQLIVSDNGIGIPENRKKELFELGKHRVSYGTEQEKGTGLGLLLVSDFLKLNNGKIDIESQVGKGTTIRVTLLRS
jgi:signal transduction histidine kinase